MSKAQVTDATKTPYTSYGVGVKKNNPRFCLTQELLPVA